MFCLFAVLMLGGNTPQDIQPVWHATLNPAVVLVETDARLARGLEGGARDTEASAAGDAMALCPGSLAPARIKGQRPACARGARRTGSGKTVR